MLGMIVDHGGATALSERPAAGGIAWPVGAKNSMRLRDLRIFVDHRAESIASYDRDLGVVELGERS